MAQIVLMTHHGMAIRGTSTRDAVFRANYARQDALVTLQTVQLGASPSRGGMFGFGFGLTPREAADAERTTESESL